MKTARYVPLFLLLAMSTSALAECNVTASQQSLSYGRLSPAERQLQGKDNITLMEKQVVVRAVCDTPSRVRLYIGSRSANGNQFGFGNNGSMKVTVANAYLDDRSVRLSKVHGEGDAVTDSGQASMPLSVNDGLAFVDNGEQPASQVSVTLTVEPTFKNEAITDTTDYTGHLRIRVEAQ